MKLGTPARGLAFIKHIETEETYRGGTVVIPDQARDKIAKMQFIVVAVGGPERCGDPDECDRPHILLDDPDRYHGVRVSVGDWVLCRNRSWAATPDPYIFVVRQSDILGKFIETPVLPKRRRQPAP